MSTGIACTEKVEEPLSPDDVIFDTSYRVPFDLGNGLKVDTLFFNRNETKLIYGSTFTDSVHGPGIRRIAKPSLVCEFSCIASYELGILKEFKIFVHVTIPERLGKVYAWGVDISPGAKTFVEFNYKIVVDEECRINLLKLEFVQVGSQPKIYLDDLEGIMQPVNFPYPIENDLKVEFGKVNVPFLVTNHPEDHTFEVLVDIRQDKK